MKLHFPKKYILCLAAAVLLICGCATSQTQQTTRRYVWPRPPAQPKIEWLKSYYSQHDFPKTGFESAMEVIFGESEPITFEKPIDIKSNGNGLVYVTDIVRNAVFVYDLVNFKVSVWKNGGDSERSLAITPYFISLDRESNAYVVGTGDKKIYVLDTNGALKRKIDFAETVKAVGGIAVDDARNRIYLVDSGGGKIEVFDISGKHLFSFGKPGDAGGEFNRPLAITINHKGEIIVGDTMNARVQIFDGEGKFLRKFGQRGDAGPDFQVVKGISVDSDDNIYVADGKANQIKIFNTRGEYLLSFGTAYSVPITRKEAPGGFLLPQGIHIDKNDSIFITDQANMRFQHFKYLKDSEATEKVPDSTGIKK